MSDVNQNLLSALKELLIDMTLAQSNMRKSALYDNKWEGCAEAIQPRVDAARKAVEEAEKEQQGVHVAVDTLDMDLPDSVIEATAQAIGEAYDCMRVWEAWSVGTMSKDDFWPVTDDVERVVEIAHAAIFAWRIHNSSKKGNSE